MIYYTLYTGLLQLSQNHSMSSQTDYTMIQSTYCGDLYEDETDGEQVNSGSCNCKTSNTAKCCDNCCSHRDVICDNYVRRYVQRNEQDDVSKFDNH